MKRTGRIKPSKPVSFFQMIGGGIFAIIGLAVIIPLLAKEGGPMWFGALWTLIAVIGGLIGAYNFFSEDGIAVQELSYTSKPQTPYRSMESRLEELKQLKDKGLIDAHEYETKRSELLNHL